ncbi:methyl-accepting chemotaxis protein [Kushneria aurantia]|uniref:Methyl-accepting chemotaxis protein n=1 Tax=Kushneria aurantia TaxID=504092 RepID=A0ABV6G051_9GAMM|nr:methyl-accepting chemotaxis protein [Kushneria aurantia]
MKNINISKKLYLGFGAIVAIMIALVATIMINIQALQRASDWVSHSNDVLQKMQVLTTSLINMETGERGFLLTGRDASLEPYNQGQKDFESSHTQLVDMTSDNPAQQQRLARLGELEQQWQQVEVTPALEARRQVVNGTTSMNDVVNFQQREVGKEMMDGMRAVLDEMISAEDALSDQRVQAASGRRQMLLWVSIGGGAIAVLLAALLGYLLSRSIVNPLRSVEEAANAMAEGRLSVVPETRRGDEIGRLLTAFRRMDERLTGIVTEVRQGADSVSVAAGQIASGNNDLSRRSQDQAASLEETAASMEEMNSTVRQNADNAGHASQLANEVSDQATSGGEVADRAMAAMEEINASSRRIADIVGLIDDIAFQTNLLALNASVEAARAGEQGRGFAVVAGEVRNLASRSSTAARDIKQLVEESVVRVEGGSKLVHQSGDTLKEIVESVKRVSGIVSEIAAASKEQSSGIEQANVAIAQMDNTTQQNAAMVEEAAAASHSLQQQAETLKQLMLFFNIENGGQSQYTPAIAHGGSATTPRHAVSDQRPSGSGRSSGNHGNQSSHRGSYQAEHKSGRQSDHHGEHASQHQSQRSAQTHQSESYRSRSTKQSDSAKHNDDEWATF